LNLDSTFSPMVPWLGLLHVISSQDRIDRSNIGGRIEWWPRSRHADHRPSYTKTISKTAREAKQVNFSWSKKNVRLVNLEEQHDFVYFQHIISICYDFKPEVTAYDFLVPCICLPLISKKQQKKKKKKKKKKKQELFHMNSSRLLQVPPFPDAWSP